jgi:hypothetical protein
MSEDLHNDIDDIFRGGLEGHEEQPDESVWANIDHTLDKRRVISISKKYRVLKWAAAAILLFSIGMAMYAIHSELKRKEAQSELEAYKNNVNENSKPARKSTTTNSSKNQPQKKLFDTSSLQEKNSNRIITKPSIKENRNTNTQQKNGSPIQSNIIANHNLVPKEKTVTANNTLPETSVQKSTLFANSNGSKVSSKSEETNKNNSQNARKTSKSFVKSENAGILSPKNLATNNENKKQKNVAINSLSQQTEENQNLQEDRISQIRGFSKVREKNIETSLAVPQLSDSKSSIIDKPINNYKNINGFKKLLHKAKANYQMAGIKTNSNPSRVSLNLYYSPDIMAKSLANDVEYNRDEDRNKAEKEEQNRYSFSTGLLIGYKISPLISVQTGIKFLSWNTDISSKTIYAREDPGGQVHYRFDCAAGYSDLNVNSGPPPIYGDSLEALGSQNTVQYISVPVLISFSFGNSRFRFMPSAGFTANLLTGGQLNTTLATTSGIQKVAAGSIQGLRSMYLSGQVGLGAEYFLTRHIALTVMPRAEIGISSINKNAPFKTHLYTFGFGGGLAYNF